MSSDIILTIIGYIIAGIEGFFLYLQWKDMKRIKAKEEVWNRDVQSIVNVSAKMQERIDKKMVKDAKELRSGIESIGAFANGIHVSIKEELKIRD